jgi:hypothetical protein
MPRVRIAYRPVAILVIVVLTLVALARLHGIAASAPPEAHVPAIAAAGTATVQIGAQQDNVTFAHVKLAADVAAHLGDDYIVLVSARYPKGGWPFFTPYWKPAADGFDVTMVDPSLGPDSTASYNNPNHTYPVDWIVVRK